MTCEVTNLEWRRQLGRKSESVSAEAEEEDPVAGSHPEDLRWDSLIWAPEAWRRTQDFDLGCDCGWKLW
jgi:hypothetical protein